MVTNPSVRASEIILDGAYRSMPGFALGAYRGDRPVDFIQSGVLDFFDGTAAVINHFIPFNYEVVGAVLLVTEQLGTGASLLNIGAGQVGAVDADKFVDDYSVATAVTAGTLVDLTLTATLTGAAGDLVQFTSGTGATTTGKGIAQLWYVPRHL